MQKHVPCFILVGFHSSGKTRFGKLLAEAASFAHLDTDRLIEEMYAKQFGKRFPCRKIALKLGMDLFRQIEKRAIAELDPKRSTIVSTGGGTPVDPENCTKLKRIGKIVYLNTPAAIILERLRKNGIPSFIDRDRIEESFRELYESRKPIYEQAADHEINLENRSDETVLEQLKHIVENRR